MSDKASPVTFASGSWDGGECDVNWWNRPNAFRRVRKARSARGSLFTV
jgi:hypothetical protein